MGDTSFVPGLIILGIGLAIAVVVTVRMLGAARADKKRGKLEDARLRVDDLEQRRDEIYDRLRGTDVDLDAAERRRLERSAALVLQQLDHHAESLESGGGTAAAEPAQREQRAPRRHAGLIGFAFGAGMVALVGVLFVWVSRDATPAPPQQTAGPTPTGAATDAMAPEIAARVRVLEARVATDSRDLGARKELAEIFIQLDMLMEAFGQSESILEHDPRDADGLYVQGLVRLSMGQSVVARQLLDRAIDELPGHTGARLVRGIIYLQSDDREAAIADWEAGLEASGGSHPALARLIEMARQGNSADEIFGAPPSTETASPAAAGAGIRVTIDVGAGHQVPAGAVLFVSLRSAEPGPPVAVKRIDSPSFPIELVLDERDSMLGRPLPDAGLLRVRLDGDGSASTRSEGDLSAEAEATIGESIVLTLTAASGAEG